MCQITFEIASSEHVDMMNDIEIDSFITPWSYQSIYDDVVNNKIATYLVALSNKQVIGYAGSWHVVGEAHITTLAVRKDFRRQHVGENMLLDMFRRLKEEKITAVTLEVRENNTGALLLYEKLGFDKAGIRKNYYSDSNEDAIIMWKKL